MDRDRASEIARQCVDRLAQEEGLEVRFPFDYLWKYAEEEIPSTLKPARRNQLIREGYIEDTGARTNAYTERRAGSATPEYRLGPRYRPAAAPRAAEGLSIAGSLKRMERTMAADGFVITAASLANFYLALMTSPLVILAGISGIGKSRLPRLFARRIGADFTFVSVQPQWSDNADLFGYTPSLDREQFISGPFTQALVAATQNPSNPCIVLLDEMNLAAVEHYFSDFLSVMQTREKQSDGTITTDILPLDLPAPQEEDPYADLRELRLLPNIRVVGTANMDETTRLFSPKVLDRAFSIEFDEVDLTVFPGRETVAPDDSTFPAIANRIADESNPVSASEVYDESQPLFDCIAALLEQIKDILKPAGISFGYRTRDDICLYMWHWLRDDLLEVLSAKAALDLCVFQKVLPKISGTGEALRQSLESLLEWLRVDEADAEKPDDAAQICMSRPWLRSAEKVERMLQRLGTESATTFWGT